MKLNRLLFIVIFCFLSLFTYAQAPPANSLQFEGFNPELEEEITPEQRKIMFQSLKDNIIMLAKKGITAEGMLKKGPITTKLGWPLRKAAGFTDPSYYGISNFIDQDPTAGIKDYNCGKRTYNGHLGTDIFTAPFWWKKMDENSVEIIAAADGIIIDKGRIREDTSCAMCPVGAPNSCFSWNGVYLQHADGSLAMYGHMKKNSPTSKNIGDVVKKGEYLGIVGSSGNSSGPHLHFELWTDTSSTGTVIDPWAGTCNSGGNTSMWEVQQPYYNPQIIKLMTGDASIEVKPCYNGAPENTHERKIFNYGETVYITTIVRDHTATGPNYAFKLYGPDNKIIYDWVLPASTYPGHYSWLWLNYIWDKTTFKVPGVYKYTLNYNGEYAETLITILSAAPLNLISFSAKAIGEKVALNWQTTDEDNTSHTEVEHSTDGEIFQMIGKIPTTGNDRSGKNNYSLNDYNPAPGMNFYRLKMVDKDGKFTYSNIEKVNIVKLNAVRVFPNPATNIVTLQGVKNYSRVRISSLQGSELMSKTFEGDELKLNISNLPAGVYLLQLGKETFTYNVKLLKK